jgi:uncharacterized membrane protein
MLAVTFYSVVKWIHIMAVVVAFGAAFTYPIWFSFVMRAPTSERAFFHRTQAFIGRRVIGPGLLVIVVAGIYMASNQHLWSKAWVTVPFVIAIIIGGLGGAYFGPRELRLAELAAAGGGAEYTRLFAQVRNVTYVMLALVAIAAYMMVTKVGS